MLDEDGERRHAENGERDPAAAYGSIDRERDNARHGANNDVVRQHSEDDDRRQNAQRKLPVDGEDHAEIRGKTLAALEAEVDGETVSKQACNARDAQSDIAAQKPSQPHGEHALDAVAQKRQRARPKAQHARNVGRARVAASERAHVLMEDVFGNTAKGRKGAIGVLTSGRVYRDELEEYAKKTFANSTYKDNDYKYVISTGTRKGDIDKDRLSIEHPEIDIEKYRKPDTSYQTLRVTRINK